MTASFSPICRAWARLDSLNSSGSSSQGPSEAAHAGDLVAGDGGLHA